MFANTYKYGAQKPVNIPFVFLWPTYFLYGQLDFVYGQLCTFYMVNSNFLYGQLLLFIWSNLVFIRLTIYFLYGQLEFLNDQLFTFYVVNRLFIWSTFYYLYRSVQNADCIPELKCRLKTADQGWNANWVLEESTVYDRGIDLIVKRKSEVLNVLKLLIQSTIPRSRLPSQRKTMVWQTGFLLAKQSKLPMCDGSLSLLLRPNKVCMSYVYVKATISILLSVCT